MHAHADDLRAEGAPDELAEHAKHDYRQADLDPRRPRALRLRRQADRGARDGGSRGRRSPARPGWNDAAIHDAIQVISYFNYINRVAEGVGIGPEPEWDNEPRRV